MTMENSLNYPQTELKEIDTMALTAIPQNSRPDIYERIYRVPPDELIALGTRRKNRDGIEAPRYHAAIKRRDFQEWFPQLLAWKIEDTEYQSFSTLGEGALRHNYETYLEAIREKKLPVYFRAGKAHAKSMTVLCLDLDVGRDHPGEAERGLTTILFKAREGELPWPGFIVFSGRGLYVMWLLEDEETGQAPVTTRDNQVLYEKCYTALARRVEELEADMSKAKDYAAWFKAPGTKDTKTGNRVVYMTVGIDNMNDIPVYSLRDLLEFFELPHAPEIPVIESPVIRSEKSETVKEKASVHNVKPGRGSERYYVAYREIEKIVGGRTDHEHHRHYILWHYYQNLCTYYRMVGVVDAGKEAFKEAQKLNKNHIHPPFTTDELKDACRKTKKGRWARFTTIAHDLGVTAEEAKKLELKHILPDALATEKKFKDQHHKQSRKEAFEKRRQIVDALIIRGENNNYILSLYGKELGLTSSYLYQHRKSLGLDTDGDPKKPPKDPSFDQLLLPGY